MRQEDSYQLGGFTFRPQDLARILGSADGQRLMALLQRDGGGRLRAAVSAASAGRAEEAKSILAPLLEDPEAQELLKKLTGGG